MAWAIVTNGTSDSNGAIAVTSLASTLVIAATNNLLIVCGAWSSLNDVGISDTKGNTWTKQIAKTTTGQYYIIWAIANGTGSTTITVTGDSSTFNSCYSTEYSGNHLTAPFHKSSFGYGLNNSQLSLRGNLLETNVASCLLIAFGDAAVSSGSVTVGAGFTLRKTNANNAQVMEDATSAATPGNEQGLFVCANTDKNWAVFMAAFLPPAGTVVTRLLKR